MGEAAACVQVRKNAAHDGQHFGKDVKPDRAILKRKAPAA